MQPDEIKSYGCVAKWLTEGERQLYLKWEWILDTMIEGKDLPERKILSTLEALAATRELSKQRRVLLEKHQYQYYYNSKDESEGNYCIGCEAIEGLDCKPDCTWDAALKGVGGE